MRIAHTADLDDAALAAVRELLDDAFAGDFSEDDWEHALGGMHAIAYGGDAMIGHAAVVQRRMIHRGRTLRCGYVEAVGVRADHRRGGVGSEVMDAVERIIRGAYDLGALSASEDGAALYAARGWELWQGPTSALTPDGMRGTPDAGSVYVLPVGVELDPSAELTCDWRDGDVW